MFCDPNILRHDSDSSSKGATSGMGLGRVKTPTFNLRVETPSRFRKFENQKCLRPLLREDDRENNFAHSWLVHVFTQPGPRPDIVRGGVENDSFQPVRLAVPARWCLLD